MTVNTCSEEDEPFEFLPPELEPKIAPALKEKAENAIKVVAKLSFAQNLQAPPPAQLSNKGEDKKERRQSRKLSCFPSSDTKGKRKKKKRPATKLSVRLKQAGSQGFQIMKGVLFPSIPAVLQDLWVYMELAITVTAFVFGALDTFSQSSNLSIYTYVYFILAVVSFTLVLTDGYLYFIELGSCARGYRLIRSKLKERSGLQKDTDMVEVDEGGEERSRKWYQLSPKWRQYFNTWFEVIRNTLTELLLYPLLIFDLLSFITERGYQPSDSMQRADFGLFLMESFYLVLSVYIMRIVLVTTSMISLIRLPTDKNDDSTKPILIRFSVHMIGQIIVHIMIVLVVAAKINNENPALISMMTNSTLNNGTSGMVGSGDDGDSDVNASYFLIVAMVTGGIVPLAGSAMFFLANYYWMRQFSISFWVNMISLLQGESFAEAVFGGEGVSSKEKAREFVQQSQFSKVKKELKKFKSPTLFTKLRFPAQIPGLVALSVLYNVLFLTFVGSLMLTQDQLDGSIQLAVFGEDDGLTSMFVISTLTLIIANIHVLVLINTLLLACAVILVLFIGLLALSILLSVAIVFPMLGAIGFSLLLNDICNCLFVRKSPCGQSTEYPSSTDSRSGSTHGVRNGSFDSTKSLVIAFEDHNYQQYRDKETKL